MLRRFFVLFLSLLGFRAFSQSGDTAIVSSLFQSYLFPAAFGILGFYDVGRIWYKNENGLDPSAPGERSSLWHDGAGGGIWFTPFNLTVLSLEAAHSPEGTLGYIRVGFQF